MKQVSRLVRLPNDLLRRLSDPRRGNLLSQYFEPIDQLKPTVEDVYYCYRLFWQRPPRPEELAFWTDRLGHITLQTLIENFAYHDEYRALEKERSQPTVVELDGFGIYVRMRDWVIGAPLAIRKSYEPHVTREMKNVLRSSMVFVDLGANIGYFTLLAASRVSPKGKVIAFEPNPDNCELIQESVALNEFENVVLYSNAIANREGEFYLNWEFNATHSNPSVQSQIPSSVERIVTRAVVVDKMLEHERQIDVIKMDIEGWEALALKGMTQVLQQHRPILFTEFFPAMLETYSKVDPRSYLEDIQSLGFHLFVLPHVGEKSPTPFDTNQVMAYWASLGNPYTHVDLVAYPC